MPLNKAPSELQISLWCGALFFSFLLLGMLSYHGGNPANPTAPYSFLHNFFSDLGTIKPYSNVRQPLTNFLFTAALTSAGLGIISFVRGITQDMYARFLADLTALSLLAVTLLPSDEYFWPHRYALFAFVLLVTLTFGTILRTNRGSAIQVIFWTALVYACFLVFAPRPDSSDSARLLHVIAQKGITLIIFGSLTLASFQRTKLARRD